MKYFGKPVRVGQAQDSHIWGIQMAQTLDVDIFAAMESAPPLTWYGDAIDCAWDVAEAGYPVEVDSMTVARTGLPILCSSMACLTRRIGSKNRP
jgi:hypothetical protein